MTLYLKYRPKTLDELDLKSTRETLENIIKSNNIPHAFLFAGPKGTGKTSAARIIAKIVNCIKNEIKLKDPCNNCDQCKSITNSSNIDVIELDAASHRGIDDIRVLRDAVKLSPAKSRIKVYIIDEAHMLTTEASNALLKILEEPPKHVMFILATTNPEKLISTIRSRTTIVHFNKATNQEIIRSLNRISKGEKIKADEKVLELISQSSDGSFRDATKILDQIMAEKIKLDYEHVDNYLNKKTDKNVKDFLICLKEKNENKSIGLLDDASKRGISAEAYADETLNILRNSLLAKVGIGEDGLSDWTRKDEICLIELLIDAKSKIPYASIEYLPIELVVIKWCIQSFEGKKNGNTKDTGDKERNEENKDKGKQLNTRLEDKENGKDNEAPTGLRPGYLLPTLRREQNPSEAKNSSLSSSSLRSRFFAKGDKEEINGSITDQQWKKILDGIKPINTSIEALLRAAKPIDFDGRILKLGVFYKFHKERLEDGRNKRVLEGVIEKVLSIPTKVVCTLTKPPDKELPKNEIELTEGEDKNIIKVAKDIFGS